jgi:predicted secreted Zn-dependent protease
MKRHFRVFSEPIILFFLSFLGILGLFSDFQVKSENQPAVSVKTIYYPIAGTTAARLREEMSRHGPIDPATGKRFAGYTSWRVRWYYRTFLQGDRCRLSDLRVNTDITITLPRWNPPRNAARSLVTSWTRFIKAMEIHENGHANHGIAASREIARLIAEIPPKNTCSEVINQLSGRANAILQTYSQKDIEYDRRTRHGITQGTVLP